MQQTANYNLNLPVGTDVVNPLVDYNPNFSTIDSVMKANADRTVGRATCIKSGTTHVVTRSNTGSNIINFTATGDWNAGDTMTIDSTIVSVFLPDGSAALDGAYLINTEVFGILNGTRFTLYSNVVDVPEQTAANTSYDNTGSGLAANNVQGAIDELANPGSVSVIADGVKTIKQLLNELNALVNSSKVNPKSKLLYGSNVLTSRSTENNIYRFYVCALAAGSVAIWEFDCDPINSAYKSANISTTFTYTDLSSNVPAAGTKFELIY